MIRIVMPFAIAMAIVLTLSEGNGMGAPSNELAWMQGSISKLEAEMAPALGKEASGRLREGLRQVARFWREGDGGAAEFDAFVRAHFAPTPEARGAVFRRFESQLEKLSGHLHEIQLAFREPVDLDAGPILPVDEIFAAYDPGAHLLDDFFRNKLAFVVLLNFPLTTLEERLGEGASWTRREWAEARLAQRFSKRIPAEVQQAIARASAASDQYIAEYNVWMHHLLDERGDRLFPPKMRLLSHWNLRDEIKAQYAKGAEGLPRQRMIRKVMERIVDQTIPEVVVNNPHVDWNPFTNEVRLAAVNDSVSEPPADFAPTGAREPDTRYAMLLGTFRAARLADPYSPTAPTLIDRRFDEDREIPEERVRAMFEAVLSSPLAARTAARIEKRLGRPLEPFDIWYDGFRPRGKYTEEELDAIVRKRYPSAEAYENDIPEMLRRLGFAPDRADAIASKIVVDPARGSGHAWGAEMRSEKAHLRTRVGADGMDYKGFNIAVHEMGHNVEQVISLVDVDHTLLAGVPNTAFTEALAFVFQGHDLDLLGLASRDERAEALETLDAFWGTYEIAGVALVDMEIWRWMYEHPEATPAQLREAMLSIAKEVWNRYFAPVIGVPDVTLLAIYSHIIHSFLYVPDYPLGHMIAFQIGERMRAAGKVGPEFDRMARAGRIAPDLWMKNATGSEVGPEALLAATERALATIEAEEGD
jgi:hypothetical protein